MTLRGTWLVSHGTRIRASKQHVPCHDRRYLPQPTTARVWQCKQSLYSLSPGIAAIWTWHRHCFWPSCYPQLGSSLFRELVRYHPRVIHIVATARPNALVHSRSVSNWVWLQPCCVVSIFNQLTTATQGDTSVSRLALLCGSTATMRRNMQAGICWGNSPGLHCISTLCCKLELGLRSQCPVPLLTMLWTIEPSREQTAMPIAFVACAATRSILWKPIDAPSIRSLINHGIMAARATAMEGAT